MHAVSSWAYGIKITAFNPSEPYVMMFTLANCEASFAGVFGTGDWFTDDIARNHIPVDTMSSFFTRDRV